jgi:hypothetical protein
LAEEGLISLRAPCLDQGITRNGTLLESVALGVVTSIAPDVAPLGTVAVIDVPVEFTVNDADSPLNETAVAPVSP